MYIYRTEASISYYCTRVPLSLKGHSLGRTPLLKGHILDKYHEYMCHDPCHKRTPLMGTELLGRRGILIRGRLLFGHLHIYMCTKKSYLNNLQQSHS